MNKENEELLFEGEEKSVEEYIKEVAEEEKLSSEEIQEMIKMFQGIKVDKAKTVNKRKRDKVKSKNKKKIAKKSKRRNR